MSNLGLLPIALVVLCVLTFITSYIIGVSDGDVPAAFPYISDTGSKRPESCIFGLFLNIAVFLSFSTIYIRFKAVQALAATLVENRWLRRMNKVTLIIGIISCLGCSVVANFQEGTEVEVVHMIGATVTFAVGILYCFLQTALSYQMYPEFNGRRICKIRLGVSIVSILSAVLTIVAAAYALYQWDNSSHDPDASRMNWKIEDAGFAAHVVSTSGEWLTALSFFGFFLTYVREFDKFEVDLKMRPLVFNLNESPISAEEADERTRLLM